MGRKSESRKLEAAARSQYPQLFRHGGPEPVEAPVEARPPESGSEDGSMVRASASRWIQWHVPVLVALVTFTAFWPALQNQFVDWDDSKNFVDNPQYRGLAVLSGLFSLSTILVYLRAYAREAPGRRSYWLSVALFGCALLSKSMAVSLPIVLLILDVYPLRRLGGSLGWWSEPARRVYVEKIPFVLLAAAASALAVRAQSLVHSMAPLDQLSVAARLAVSAYGLSFYLWKMIVPSNLSPLYPRPLTVDPWAMPFVLSYGLVLATTGIALALRRRAPALSAAWSAYVVVLLPVLGIVQIGSRIAAD